MPRYQAIAPSTHASKGWQRYSGYAFAAQDAVAPLVAQELPKACTCLPMAFIAQGERFTLVAVQGLQPGRNLFVAPDGRWLGGYTPAVYRGYPFALAQADNDQLVLCVDADSALVGEATATAHEAGAHVLPFFDAQGQPAPPVKEVLNFLQQVHGNGQLTQRICAALQAEGLIAPWPLTVKGGQGERQVQGLHRIDEARLNALDGAALQRLQQAGALPMAYCQLLSMQHLPMLGKLAEAHAQAQAQTPLPTTPNGELDLEFLNNNGTLNFSNL